MLKRSPWLNNICYYNLTIYLILTKLPNKHVINLKYELPRVITSFVESFLYCSIHCTEKNAISYPEALGSLASGKSPGENLENSKKI